MTANLSRVGVYGENTVIVAEKRTMRADVHLVRVDGDAVDDLRLLRPLVRRLDSRINHLACKLYSSVGTDPYTNFGDLAFGRGDEIFGARLFRLVLTIQVLAIMP